jgi:uncharacterized membrane protein YhhN
MGVAFAFAALDWVAVAQRRSRLEYACKPGAALAFLATAAVLDPASNTARVWFCVALAACVVGDVLLMIPRDAFVFGLGAFVVAQVCFTIGFTHEEPTAARLVAGVVIVALVVGPLAWRFVHALRARGKTAMIAPVAVYIAVIAAMVVSAIAGGSAWGIAGAVLFLVSDSLIAENRFVAPRAWAPIAVMVTYHLALAGLVIGLV